jgi:hypothetical protein
MTYDAIPLQCMQHEGFFVHSKQMIQLKLSRGDNSAELLTVFASTAACAGPSPAVLTQPRCSPPAAAAALQQLLPLLLTPSPPPSCMLHWSMRCRSTASAASSCTGGWAWWWPAS